MVTIQPGTLDVTGSTHTGQVHGTKLESYCRSCHFLPSGCVTVALHTVQDCTHTFHEHRLSCGAHRRAPQSVLALSPDWVSLHPTDSIVHRLSLSDCLTHRLGKQNLVSSAVLPTFSVKSCKLALIICSFGYSICLFLILLMTLSQNAASKFIF